MRQLDWGVAEDLKETTIHGTKDFPVAIYLNSTDAFDQNSTLLHWHDELQIVLVESGTIDYIVEDDHFLVDVGDIIFINSKCLHMASQVGEETASYICINFHPRLLYGNSNYLAAMKYVAPIINSENYHASVFTRADMDFYSEIHNLVQYLITQYEGSEYGRELIIFRTIIDIWLAIIRHNRSIVDYEANTISPNDRKRINTIIGYIQEHYHEKLSLKDIALVLRCSPEECCRIFSRTLKQTPITYLNNIRIISSLGMLTSTEKSISEIAHDVGFGSSSYYTEKFKKIMNCKPLEYRKRFANSTKLKRMDLHPPK